jgi:hypothetical protein
MAHGKGENDGREALVSDAEADGNRVQKRDDAEGHLGKKRCGDQHG